METLRVVVAHPGYRVLATADNFKAAKVGPGLDTPDKVELLLRNTQLLDSTWTAIGTSLLDMGYMDSAKYLWAMFANPDHNYLHRVWMTSEPFYTALVRAVTTHVEPGWVEQIDPFWSVLLHTFP